MSERANIRNKPVDSIEEQTGGKLTHADYLLFPDDGRRHELIDGEHFVTASPLLRHQAVLQNLSYALDAIVRRERLGRLFVAPLDVILSDFDVVEPDLLFVSIERREILRDWVRGAPDLVVEILSPSTRHRDETLKRELYERRGVAEYWIVDPEAESVKVFRARDGVFERPILLTAEGRERLTSPLLPGLSADLGEIFERD